MANDLSLSLPTSAEDYGIENILIPLENGGDDILGGFEREETPEPLSNSELDVLLKKTELLGACGDEDLAKMASYSC